MTEQDQKVPSAGDPPADTLVPLTPHKRNHKNSRYRNLEGRSVINDVMLASTTSNIQQVAAKSIPMDVGSYSLVRQLLLLLESHISNDEKDQVRRAIADIDSSGFWTKKIWLVDCPSVEAASLIVKKYVKRGRLKLSKDKTGHQQIQRRLETTLIHIRESCESTADMEIPIDLSPADAKKAIATLARSTGHISRLIRRLSGENEDD